MRRLTSQLKSLEPKGDSQLSALLTYACCLVNWTIK